MARLELAVFLSMNSMYIGLRSSIIKIELVNATNRILSDISSILTKTLIVSALPLAASLFQPVNLSYYLIIELISIKTLASLFTC